MALQFPSSPTNGQIYYDSTSGNRYIYELVTTSWKYAGNNDLLTTSSNTQVLYNTNNGIIGSNGLTFSANTLYTNTINVNQNVTAQYFLGNGVFLTGIVTDFSPAFNVANAAFGHSNITYTAVNSAFAVINANYTSTNANYVLTNANYTSTNANYVLTNAAFTQSNTDNVRLSAAYVSINAGYTVVNAAYAVANAAYGNANNLSISANAYAGAMANSGNAYAGAMANSGNAYANLTYVKLTAGQQTITGDLNITGNLTFLGNSTVISSGQLSVGDSLIYLASNNYSGTDLVDIGFIANYGNTTLANVHTGLVRDATNKQYYLFQGYDAEPANNTFVPGGNNMSNAVLVADFNTSNLTLGGANAIVWIKSSYDNSNGSFGVVNAAFGHSNTTYGAVNSAFGVINAAYGQANTLATSTNAYASAVGTSTNNYTSATYSTLTQFGSVFGVANAAFGKANTALANTANVTFAGRFNIPERLLVTQSTSGTNGILVNMPTGAETTASGLRVMGYSPAIELMDKDSVQNWYMGIDDNDSNKLIFGRGYGPGQGVTQAITVDTSDNVGIGTASPLQKLHVKGLINSSDGDSSRSVIGWTTATTWGGVGLQLINVDNSNLILGTNNTGRLQIDVNGNVAIGQATTTYKLQVNGSFAATTKSFVIDHPSKPGMKLRYGSLEGPENGVYIRGRISGQNFIEYPDYWSSLVDIDTTTVQLTPIGDTAMPRVAGVLEDRILLLSDNKNIDCYYFIQAERKDVEKLIVEF